MINKYDIVLIPFPFTDLSSVKLRPAVVVGNPYGDDIIVVFITTDKKNIGVTDVRVKKSPENGLKKDSAIKCAKVVTLDTKILIGKLGVLEIAYQKSVQKKMKKIFGL